MIDEHDVEDPRVISVVQGLLQKAGVLVETSLPAECNNLDIDHTCVDATCFAAAQHVLQKHREWSVCAEIDRRVRARELQKSVSACVAETLDKSRLPSPPPLFATLPDGLNGILPDAKFTRDPLNGWTLGNHPAFTPEWQDKLQDLLREYRSAFAYTMKDLEQAYSGADGPFRVDLLTEKRLVSPMRRKSPAEQAVVDQKAGELRDAGLIEPAPPDSPYVCETTCPLKRDLNGLWTERRFCIDYRPVNNETKPDNYGLNGAEQLFQKIGAAKGQNLIFSKLDMKSGFHQIPIAEEDRHKLAFRWGSEIWQFKRMPFGCRNASAKFQRVMDRAIQDAGLGHCCVVYIDDVLVFSASPAEHLQHLAAVLRMIKENNLRAHPDKTILGAEVVEYIGHYVSAHGLSPTQARASAIRQLSAPKDLAELKAMLGFMGYYRSFLPNYSAISQPLTSLMKKDAEWKWGPEQQRAFEQLKDGLSDPNKVLRPMDFSKPVFLYTDWSCYGISGVLAQKDDDGKDYIVACVSRSLNQHERNYGSPEGELLAVVWATKTLRLYLHGVRFTLVTDHTPLLHLMKDKDLSGKRARWALLLQEYHFDVVHRAGVKHANADYPSRYPSPSSADYTGARLDEDSDQPPPLPKVYDAEGVLQVNLVAMPPVPKVCELESTASVNLAMAVPLLTAKAVPAVETALASAFMDPDELIGHNAFSLAMASDVLQDEEEVHPDYSTAVRLALSRPSRTTIPAQLPLAVTKEGDSWEVQSIDTTMIGPQFFPNAERGLVVLELFGGICTVLEMLLRTGHRVQKYYYCDIDPAARAVAQHRIGLFLRRYPTLVTPATFADSFIIPQDVKQLSPTCLKELAARHPESQWLIAGGWECQDLSPAGKSNGIHGKRSSTFFDLTRILACLQSCLTVTPPGYLLENVSMRDNFNSAQVREYSHRVVTSVIGLPVTVDAAQFGSRAHRLRSFWSNVFCPRLMTRVLKFVKRPVGLTVDDILDPGRSAQADLSPPSPPFYQCHAGDSTPSLKMLALPTFVSYVGSRAFREGARGMIFDHRSGQLVEPNADERERAMGFYTRDTAAPGVSEVQRHEITGRCMDINTLVALWSCAKELARREGRGAIASALHVRVHFEDELWHEAHYRTLALHPNSGSECYQAMLAQVVTELEDAQDAEVAPGTASRDVWLDSKTLQYLQQGIMPSDSTREERKRIVKRAAGHQWTKERLYRLCADGQTRIVPPPEQRTAIIWETHKGCGHFGVLRTISLLRTTYYWSGLDEQVRQLLARCTVCDCVRASFGRPSVALQPLPIEPMFYRVGVDLFGPIKSKGPYQYGMVIIEHFSKHLEVVPLEKKTAALTARAFLTHFIARFGACAEVLTDGGTEFKGEFEQLLVRCRIDHRVTSPSHPQADGLAERAVQTVKRAVTKYVESHPTQDWTEELPWILLGYRASKQSSTRFSPYFMLHARHPVIPPAIRERMDGELDLDSEQSRERAAAQLLDRAELLKQHVPLAMNNLRTAQHQDTLRYAKVRSGEYVPQLQRFVVGQFVYVKRSSDRSLEPRAHVLVLRVIEVKPTGVLKLQGKCGGTVNVHSSNCAPCHLAGVDASIDPSLFRPPTSLFCQLCKSSHRAAEMLVCDQCNTGWHLSCMHMGKKIPKGLWTCPDCCRVGKTAEWLTEYRRDLGLLREADDPAVVAALWSAIPPATCLKPRG